MDGAHFKDTQIFNQRRQPRVQVLRSTSETHRDTRIVQISEPSRRGALELCDADRTLGNVAKEARARRPISYKKNKKNIQNYNESFHVTNQFRTLWER